MKYTLPLIFTLGASTAFAADLIVYTYDSFASDWGPGPAIEKGFEAQCDCDLEFVAAGDGAGLLTRLKLEGDKTNADVIVGLDQNLLDAAKQTDFFAEHGFDDVAIAGTDIIWNDAQFTPYDWGHFAFVYRKNDIENPPTSLGELAVSDLKVAIQDPRVSTPGLGLALWVDDVFGDEAVEYWEALADNVLTVSPGWSEAYALFLDGKADMVLSYTTSPAYHAIAEGDDGFAAAKFDDGHPLQIETMALIKPSDAHDLGRDFMHYMQSNDGQAALSSGNWMYPVTADALPEGFADPAIYMTREPANTEADLERAREEFREGLGG